MQISYPSFDQLVTEQFPGVYRLCLLLTKKPSDAWQTTFQTFLYMGAQTEAFEDPEAELDALFSFCLRTCTDYYYRKLRRRLKRDAFKKSVPFPVSDSLWELLGFPLRKKASIFFTDFLGFTEERSKHILNGKAVQSGSDADAGWREAIASIQPAKDGASQLLGEIYLRFEERNVPLENKLRNIRYWWDHAVIWIAAAIIVLFAAAAYFTARIGV